MTAEQELDRPDYTGSSGGYDNSNASIYVSALSPSADIVYAVVCILLCVGAVMFNMFSIMMFVCRRQRITQPEYFLLNLMCSSLLFMCVSCPMVAVAALNHRWIFGRAGAIAHGFLAYFFGIANIISIFMVSFMRYIKTCHPKYDYLVSVRNTKLQMVFCYVYAAAWSTSPLLGWGSYGMEPHGISSSLDWASTRAEDRLYVLAAALCVILVPMVVMIYFYAAIAAISRNSSAVVKLNVSADSLSRRKRRDAQLNQVVAAVMVSFIVSWLPYTGVSLDAAVQGHYRLPVWSVAVVTVAAKVSGVVNPLVYLLMSDQYRQELIAFVRRVLKLADRMDSGQMGSKTGETDFPSQSQDGHRCCGSLRAPSSLALDKTKLNPARDSTSTMDIQVCTFDEGMCELRKETSV